MQKFWLIIVLSFGLSIMTPVNAAAPEQVEAAVADILFEFEVDEVTTYSIDEDGAAEVVLPNNTPDELYSKIVRVLKSHKDIEDVLPGRGGPACSMF